MYVCLPVVDGISGAILVHHQHLVHAWEHSLVVRNGQGFTIYTHTKPGERRG